MTMTGIFVDDQDKNFAAMISTRGELEFGYLPIDTLTRLAGEVLAAAPLVVALDYRLDEEFDRIDPADAYKGSALAQHLRDASISEPSRDFGIVLVSAEMKIRQVFAPDRTAHDLFDRVYSKERIETARLEIRGELVALGKAYRALRATPGGFDTRTILSVDPDEADTVLSQELKHPIETAAAPHIVVRTLLRTVILQPGLLCDDADAAAILGIAPSCMEAIAPELNVARLAYEGLLSSGWRRWWSHRLEAWTEETYGARPTSLPASERAVRLQRRTTATIAPALSPWNQSSDELIALACGSCRRPVEMRHTVAAFEPRLPRYAVRRRICWDCVQKDSYSYANLQVDESDADLIAVIKGADRK